MCRLSKEILATVFRVLASSESAGSSAKIRGASWGHMASETDSGSALPPSLGRVLIASILAWLSIPKTMYIQTALTQLIMPLLMWSMLTITLLLASPEMKDILRSRRSCLSGGVSQSQELDSYYIVAPFVL